MPSSMMTLPNGNAFRVTIPLWGELPITGGFTKARDAEIWCFLWSAPEQKFESTNIPQRANNIETLLWRHNGHDSVSNHKPHDCLLHRLFRRRSKKTSKPRVTGLCVGNSPGTGEFPAQMASITRKLFPFDDVIMKRFHAWRHDLIGSVYQN